MDYIVFLNALKICMKRIGTVFNCLQSFQHNQLLGVKHVFHKLNHGYGLGVLFVRDGILYKKECK